MPKTVLITGASSGFGRDTAETLFRAGHMAKIARGQSLAVEGDLPPS